MQPTTTKEPKRVSPFAVAMAAPRAEAEPEQPTLYVAGPISGHEDLNRQLFEDARLLLNVLGYRVIIPHDFVDPSLDWLEAIRTTLQVLHHVDGVAVVGSLSSIVSDGTVIEALAARHLGIPVYLVEDWLTIADKFDGLETVCQKRANRTEESRGHFAEVFAALTGQPYEPTAPDGLE